MATIEPGFRQKESANLTWLRGGDGDELGPASEALGGALVGVLVHQRGKLGPGKMLEQLIEQARDLYDWIALAQVNYRRAFLFQTPHACFKELFHNGHPTDIQHH